MRANASLLPVSSTFFATTIFANVSVNGSQPVPIGASQVPVASLLPGQSTTTNGNNVALAQCVPHNAALLAGGQAPAFDFNVQVNEGLGEAFPSAWKARNFAAAPKCG